jgi:hypothetical protein
VKVILQAQSQFELPLKKAHVEMLILYSEHHYDATCRSASASTRDWQHHPFAGLLIGWRNTINFYEDGGTPEKARVTATERQIDLLQKCMEYTIPGSTPEQEVLRRELQQVFRACRRRWRDLYEQWRVEWDTVQEQ